VTVTAPNLSVGSATVGIDMETTEGAGLGQADPNPVTVTISVPNNGMVLLSTDPTKLGTSSLTFNLAANSTSIPPFYVQGTATAPGTVQISASAPGFNPASATITVDRRASQSAAWGPVSTRPPRLRIRR
jgi:hypothetical protein